MALAALAAETVALCKILVFHTAGKHWVMYVFLTLKSQHGMYAKAPQSHNRIHQSLNPKSIVRVTPLRARRVQ